MNRSILLLVAALAMSCTAAPCCDRCLGGKKVKYWALDTPNNECAETCIDPNNKLQMAEFEVSMKRRLTFMT